MEVRERNKKKILKTKIITHPPTTTKEVPELINPATLPLGLGKELYGMQRRDQIIFNHIISVYSGHTKHPAALNYATYEHRAVQSVILPEAMYYFYSLDKKEGGTCCLHHVPCYAKRGASWCPIREASISIRAQSAFFVQAQSAKPPSAPAPRSLCFEWFKDMPCAMIRC